MEISTVQLLTRTKRDKKERTCTGGKENVVRGGET